MELARAVKYGTRLPLGPNPSIHYQIIHVGGLFHLPATVYHEAQSTPQLPVLADSSMHEISSLLSCSFSEVRSEI